MPSNGASRSWYQKESASSSKGQGNVQNPERGNRRRWITLLGKYKRHYRIARKRITCCSKQSEVMILIWWISFHGQNCVVWSKDKASSMQICRCNCWWRCCKCHIRQRTQRFLSSPSNDPWWSMQSSQFSWLIRWQCPILLTPFITTRQLTGWIKRGLNKGWRKKSTINLQMATSQLSTNPQSHLSKQCCLHQYDGRWDKQKWGVCTVGSKVQGETHELHWMVLLEWDIMNILISKGSHWWPGEFVPHA